MNILIKHLKGTLLAGIFIIIPIGITIFILKFLFNFADGILGSHLGRLMELYGHYGYIPGIGMITGAAVIYLTGLIAKNVLGSRLLKLGDNLITRIPLVKSIYTSSKQLIKVFQDGGSSYRRAVFVEWPRPGVRAVGFVTAEFERDGESIVVVYIPTMPNPTSGFALWFRSCEVLDSRMTVEDAIKFVVSGGVVIPAECRNSFIP
jgi:uncharacterized membrane protein